MKKSEEKLDGLDDSLDELRRKSKMMAEGIIKYCDMLEETKL